MGQALKQTYLKQYMVVGMSYCIRRIADSLQRDSKDQQLRLYVHGRSFIARDAVVFLALSNWPWHVSTRPA